MNSRDYVAYRKVVQRDPCSYCGAPGGTKDHITPKARGGLNEPENLTGSCRRCNQAKADRSLLRFLRARLAA